MNFVEELKKENLTGKKVLLRVDFNVSLPDKNGEIETFRIKAHKQTLGYLTDSGAKVALVSHIDPPLESFSSLVEQIGVTLGQTLTLVPHSELGSLGLMFQECPVLLIDNIRQDPREEANDGKFAAELSHGFDFYVNDAFSVCHRNHASVSAITKHLPSYAGFLIKKEVENLSKAIEMPAQGKTIVLGGAKISTKLPVIKNFLDKAEKILIGGALANVFFQAQGIKMGVSLIDDTVKPDISSPKIILPTDIVVAEKGKTTGQITSLKNLENNQWIADVGPESIWHFAEIIKKSELIIWNGPMGCFETEAFAAGTKKVAKAIAEVPYSIIGGGDTIVAVTQLGLLGQFDYISTGGGAMLAFLAGRHLPGLEALGYY